LLIAATVITVAIEFLNSETNPQVLMNRKVLRLRTELNRPDLKSVYTPAGAPKSPTEILIRGVIRPLKMLFGSPIIFLLSLYLSVVYGLLYLLFTTSMHRHFPFSLLSSYFQ
jgi:hypothetical protein